MQSPTTPPSHVLLVEQDAHIRGLFTTFLDAHGYTVSAVCEPHEALDCAARRAPHAIFTSIVFDDMDGFELCRRLRTRPETANSLIVAITGFSIGGIHERLDDAGFDGYLLKPAPLDKLLALLQPLGAAPLLKPGEAGPPTGASA